MLGVIPSLGHKWILRDLQIIAYANRYISISIGVYKLKRHIHIFIYMHIETEIDFDVAMPSTYIVGEHVHDLVEI